jgi:NDP-sugar pyrophosphorylase family protein
LIEAQYRNSREFGFRIEFSVERTPLGTGGALLQALPLTQSANVLVLNGDSYVDFELTALAETHARRNALVTMVVVDVEDTDRFGSVQLDASNARVTGFAEKSRSRGRGFINAGCYLLARNAFEQLPVAPMSFERDLLPAQLTAAYAHVVNGRFIDIGVPESYSRAPDYLR